MRIPGFAVSILAVFMFTVCYQTWAASTMDEVAQLHIVGNVPPFKFDKVLKRDLTAYFQRSKGKGITVDYQYLRRGATQTGIAYPKYYLWVRLYRRKQWFDSGAVRVAAIEKTHFEVTDYLSKTQIRKNPEEIDAVFPQPVCLKIRQLMR